MFVSIFIGTNIVVFQIEKEMNEKVIRSDFKIAWIKKPGKNIFHKEEENTDAVK